MTDRSAAMAIIRRTLAGLLAAASLFVTGTIEAQRADTGAASTSTIVGPTAGPAARAVIDRARALVEAGKSGDARVLLDSLVNASMAEPGDLADGLYWRAVLGERVADAERDWKRLVLDVPLSPRVPTALLRLGELEMVRGHPAGARTFFERLLRDYNSASERPKALLWVVRSYFDERDAPRACRTLIVLRDGDVPDGELRLQARELQVRCRDEAARIAAASSDSLAANAAKSGEKTAPKTKRDTSGAVAERPEKEVVRYGVQIAAYETRNQAETAVKRMTRRGLAAHLDDDDRPYRVRIGRYATRAEAEAVLARLKKQGQRGFVTVLTR